MRIRLLALCLAASGGVARGELSPDNPYYSIVEANVFRLEEPSEPPAPPAPTAALPEVEPEDLDLTLTGFGRFGDVDVVFLMGEDKKDNNRRKYYSVKVIEERTSPIDVLDYDQENQSVTLMYQGRKVALNMEEHGHKPGGSRPARTRNTARNGQAGQQGNGGQASPAASVPRGPLVIGGGRNGASGGANTPAAGGAANTSAANANTRNVGANRSQTGAAAGGRVAPVRRTRVVGSRDSGFETPEAQAASAIISAEQIRQNTGIAIPMPPGLDVMGNTSQSTPGGQ